MTKINELEARLLNTIAYDKVDEKAGDKPHSIEGVVTWCKIDQFAEEMGITIPECKGIMVSLVRKELIKLVEGRGEVAIWFTSSGWGIWQANDDERHITHN